jgi:hypothetical protein
MTYQDAINDLFDTWRNGTDQDRAEVGAFMRRPENKHLLSRPEFMQAALTNADLFTFGSNLTLDEFLEQIEAEISEE